MSGDSVDRFSSFCPLCICCPRAYPVRVHAQQSSLADVAADVAVGAAGPGELHEAFLGAWLYCERGDSLGFRALGAPGGGVIPVFSSPQQLALARGAVSWFSMTGSDLLDLVPPGYDLLLDAGGSAPLRLRPAALARRTVVHVYAEAAQ